jgi:GT2 family glycosyltransferase
MTVSAHTAIIINSYNRLNLLKSAVEAIHLAFSETAGEYAIVVFEAGSTDGSMDFLRSADASCPSIPLLICHDEADTSFSSGCNMAASHAIKTIPDLAYLLFYETDNVLKNSSALVVARSLLEDQPQLGAVGFCVETHSGEKAGFGEPFPTYLTFTLGQTLTSALGLGRAQLEWETFQGRRWATSDVVYTSPLLVRTRAWNETGGMDARNFPFSDCDVDWCWRARKMGWLSGVLDIDGVVHDNRGQASEWSSNRVLRFHRARLRLLKTYRGTSQISKFILFLRHLTEYSILTLTFPKTDRIRKSIATRRILIASVHRNYVA